MRGPFPGCIQVPAVDFTALKAAVFNKLTQCILNVHMQNVRKIGGKETLSGTVDEGFHGRQQRSIAGEPCRLVRPEALVVKMSNLGESIVTATMRIAGQVIQWFQLAKHGEADICAKSIF